MAPQLPATGVLDVGGEIDQLAGAVENLSDEVWHLKNLAKRRRLAQRRTRNATFALASSRHSANR